MWHTYGLPCPFKISLTTPTPSSVSKAGWKADWKADLMASESATYRFQAMVCGYHVYRDIWVAAVGEELSCVRETDNHQDPFAVTVARSGITVGHVPRKISSICSMFLRQSGVIECRVTGARRYSGDLPQGGLEVPCVLTFRGPAKNVDKVEKLLNHTLQVSNTNIEKENQPPIKKFKAGSINSDFHTVLTGEKLSDIPINLAQQLLKKQFLSLNGVSSTLLQSKPRTGEPLNSQQ